LKKESFSTEISGVSGVFASGVTNLAAFVSSDEVSFFDVFVAFFVSFVNEVLRVSFFFRNRNNLT